MRTTRKRFPQNGISKKKLSKKQRNVLIGLLVVVIGLAVVFVLTRTNPDAEKNGVKDAFGVTHYYSPLTGVETAPNLTLNPVTGVMIENSPDARPQAGLTEAGIVFEAVAEGGITRFLALYQEAEPELLCPVRSIRAYYLEWAAGFGANVAHVGGSGDALVMMSTGNFGEDLDQSYHPSYFWRESSRYAPHDVCTTMAKLHALEKDLDTGESKFTPFVRKDGKAVAEPDATLVNIPLATGPFDPTFEYDAATNKYPRSQGGEPHLDKNGSQIAPDVVVALDVDIALRNDNLHNDIYTIGTTHPVLIFQNGTVQRGTWLRGDDHSPLLFRDSTGKDIALNRGQTWITAISDIDSVSY